ncbi:YfbM family protein [Chitinophaga sedimenti]|uniref:YfbM family protein n=1 Tax=Chitinophaga sedimenti TaxID=2033606 RepID=UPI002002A7D9|nr:YfbM family protein [Chitinophaga sedimenti]MCK7556938.1 YfbM family protein [Chitinophaga sedimenti]
MGMIINLLQVGAGELDAILKNPGLLELRLSEKEADYNGHVDLDKAWDGLLYLLTGYGIMDIEKAEQQLAQALFSGQIIDEKQDLGLGPAHYLTPTQVRDVYSRLERITADELRKRFDPGQMSTLKIYPRMWEDGEEAFDYLSNNFEVMKAFYKSAAEKRNGMITYLN